MEFASKGCSIEELKAAEDEAIKYVLKKQNEVGLKTITDGEFRRELFFEGVFDKLEGMTLFPDLSITAFKSYIPHIGFMLAAGMQSSESILCTGKIKRVRPFYVDQFKYLKSLVPAEQVQFIKITMCSPSWFHQRHGSDGTYDLSVYKNDTEYFDALGQAYREEISDLYELGCRHIQFDDPTFCYFCSEAMISGMEKAGVDHDALFDTYVRAINICIENRPADLRVGVHMCRGNFTGGVHFCEGSYDRIAEKLFNNLDVDAFYLEYDTDRCGNFDALKYLPSNKAAVLGLMTTKSAVIESSEELIGRVYEAVEVMSRGSGRSKEECLNQLCISTQCGFASVWQGNPPNEDEQWRKLEQLVNVSKMIWPDSCQS
jgi:methionine synthase II (cobalamin-independent)